MHAVDGKIMSGVVVATMIEVDVGRRDARRGERVARRVQREVGRLLAVGGDVALADAGARADPFVAGVDALREIVVGQDLRRQVAAGAGDAAMHRRSRDGPQRRRRGSVRDRHRRDALRDPVEHAVRDLGVRLVQRVLERERVGAAVALHDDALQADERRAVVAARIDRAA